MAKLQSTEIVGVANRPATICSNTMCLWFDTTTLKPMASYCGYAQGVWSSGGNMITGRRRPSGAGTQNLGLVAGGGIANGHTTCTEEYNGTSWSAGGALANTRYTATAFGTQNEGLITGGGFSAISCTEEYNGTSWSAGGALATARYRSAGAGTQNEGLAAGGSGVSCTEEYNGTSWSAGGAMITARYNLAGAGTQNAGLAFSTSTEEYNGTSWSSGGSLITSRSSLAGAGTQNEALGVGGDINLTCTEEYNGTSWSAGAASQALNVGTGGGSQLSAFVTGGSGANSQQFNAITTEYNKSFTIIDTVLQIQIKVII